LDFEFSTYITDVKMDICNFVSGFGEVVNLTLNSLLTHTQPHEPPVFLSRLHNISFLKQLQQRKNERKHCFKRNGIFDYFKHKSVIIIYLK
jgi:hypothetical protein